MDHFNLLDFDNDVLNIIGDYVKKTIEVEKKNSNKACLIILI